MKIFLHRIEKEDAVREKMRRSLKLNDSFRLSRADYLESNHPHDQCQWHYLTNYKCSFFSKVHVDYKLYYYKSITRASKS